MLFRFFLISVTSVTFCASFWALGVSNLKLGGFVNPTASAKWIPMHKTGSGFMDQDSWEGKLELNSNVPEVVDVLVSAGLSSLSEVGQNSKGPNLYWVRMNGQSMKIKKDTIFATKLHVEPSSRGMNSGLKISVKPVGHNGRLPATVRNSEIVLVTIRIP